jgi:hypothetical protein
MLLFRFAAFVLGLSLRHTWSLEYKYVHVLYSLLSASGSESCGQLRRFLGDFCFWARASVPSVSRVSLAFRLEEFLVFLQGCVCWTSVFLWVLGNDQQQQQQQ